VTLLAFAAERRAAKRRAAAPLLLGTRAFQFGQKKFRFDSILATESIFFDSIRFGNLINLPLVH